MSRQSKAIQRAIRAKGNVENSPNARVVGLGGVLNNLATEVGKILERTETGLIKAGHFIQAESMRRTPVDTGNLRAGARTTWTDQGETFRVAVSYQAQYAIFVHERKANHVVGDWKYLERAVSENMKRILYIITAEGRLSL